MSNETAQEVPELVEQLNAAFYLGQVRALRTRASSFFADPIPPTYVNASCFLIKQWPAVHKHRPNEEV